MKRLTIISALFFLFFSLSPIFVTPAAAQQDQVNSASIYSFLGLGTPHDFRSSHAAGLSMLGVALPDPTRAGLANPAFWGATSYTTMSGGVSMLSYDASDNFGSSQSTNIDFTQFQFVFPIVRDRLGISASLYPETQSRYQITTGGSATLPSTDSLAVVNYDVTNRGTGGLNRLELGFGWRVTDNIFVGYAPSLLFGVLESDNSIVFDNNLYRPVDYIRRTRYRGFAHRFGLGANFRGLISENDQIVIGATTSLPVDLTANRRVVAEVSTGQFIDDLELIPEETYGDRTVRYPFETTAGITYFPNRYLGIGAEVHFQEWSDYTNFSGLNDPNMKDRFRVAVGFEYDALSRGNTGLFNSLIYRLGASFDDGHLNINGTDIQTTMVSMGIGIPSRTLGSSLDLNIDYGVRGTTSNDLVSERIFGLRLSFNLTEIMFLQRRLN